MLLFGRAVRCAPGPRVRRSGAAGDTDAPRRQRPPPESVGQLGIRFVALVPKQLIVGTVIGETAAAKYAAEGGITAEKYMERFPVPLDAAATARAIVDIATGDAGAGATLLGLTGKGLEVL